MTLAAGQKKVLCMAAREIGMTDEDRHLMQRNIGGFESAAAPGATRSGFIACMAFMEDLATGKRLAGFSAGYWAEQNRTANPTDGLLFKVRNLGQQLGWYEGDLDAFIAGEHMSNGAAPNIGMASGYWLSRTIGALQAMIARRKPGNGKSDTKGTKDTKDTKGTKENG